MGGVSTKREGCLQNLPEGCARRGLEKTASVKCICCSRIRWLMDRRKCSCAGHSALWCGSHLHNHRVVHRPAEGQPVSPHRLWWRAPCLQARPCYLRGLLLDLKADEDGDHELVFRRSDRLDGRLSVLRPPISRSRRACLRSILSPDEHGVSR
jgi:hypothetical protein